MKFLYQIQEVIIYQELTLKNNSQQLLVSGKSPMSIQLCNKKGILYVSNWFENTVSIIDIKKNTVINKIKTGSSPAGIFFFENAQILLVANKDDDNYPYIILNHLKN